MVVGNKSDMYESSEPDHVSAKQGRKMAKSVRAFCALQCSAKVYGTTKGTKGNVDKVFRAAIKSGLIKKGVVSAGCTGCTIL